MIPVIRRQSSDTGDFRHRPQLRGTASQEPVRLRGHGEPLRRKPYARSRDPVAAAGESGRARDPRRSIR